jgi:phosphatidylinositol transfer protein SFH5
MSAEAPTELVTTQATTTALPAPTTITAPEPTPAPTTTVPAETEAKTTEPAAPAPAAAPEATPSAPAPTAAPVLADGVWPALDEAHPLHEFITALPSILESTGHNEVYGVTLKSKATSEDVPDFHTLLILQKFLRANANDLIKAKEQLTKTLTWRKEFDPVKATTETFSNDKFDGLGFVTIIPDPDSKEGGTQVVTWNIYGAVKDFEKTFVPLDE